MKKVKSILFRVNLNGRGIVNFDSGAQKFLWNQFKKKQGFEDFDNVTYGKKRWALNEDGSADTKIAISSNCLRHEIFKEEVNFQSPNIIQNKALLLNMIASPASILRGYLFAKEITIKRSSAISITDAIQTNNAISSIESLSCSGMKLSDDNKAGTTYFRKETIGNINYSAIGAIDLMQLQFISCDGIFDRMAVIPDYIEMYLNILAKRMKINSTLGYYKIANSIIDIPEYGLKLSNESIVELTKIFFEKLMAVSIRKSGSYANVVGVQYKFIVDPLTDKLEDENGWNDLTTESLKSLTFETNNYYEDVDFDAAIIARKAIVDAMDAEKLKNKEDKNEKAKAKAAKAENKKPEESIEK